MATPPIAPRNEDVLAVIRRHPTGATVEQIETELSPAPQRRMLQYSLGLLEEQKQIVNVGTPRAPVYRLAIAAPAPVAPPAPAASAVPAATPARPPVATPPPAPAPAAVVEQRLGATAIAVNPELVKELVDLIRAAHLPAVAIKPYIRQAAFGLPNPNEFIAAVEAALRAR